jgi:hypothetical protein
MSATTAKLLQAACDITGSRMMLAEYLGVSETLLRAYMADHRELPDALLLKAVDIILEDRQPVPRLPEAAEKTENCARDGGALQPS